MGSDCWAFLQIIGRHASPHKCEAQTDWKKRQLPFSTCVPPTLIVRDRVRQRLAQLVFRPAISDTQRSCGGQRPRAKRAYGLEDPVGLEPRTEPVGGTLCGTQPDTVWTLWSGVLWLAVILKTLRRFKHSLLLDIEKKTTSLLKTWYCLNSSSRNSYLIEKI